MNSKITGNEMTMAHFHDFYFLEAMQAGLSMAKATNPEISFRRSVEKLENDINETFEKLTHTMAFRIYVYLYSASLGEARHASDNCEMIVDQLDGYGRSTVYNRALNFFPNDENVQILTDVFAQSWNSGGFGGRAWLEIVEGMKLYGKITDAAFIDHTVDLEHNSGSVFTKDTRSYINFQCFGEYNAMDLRSFLNYKFKSNILNENEKSWHGNYSTTYNVSTKIYNLLVRYSNIIEKIEAINYCKPTLEFLTPYTVEWGYETFTTSQNENEVGYQECEWCENKIDPNDHEYYNGACICQDCFNDKVSTCEKCGDNCSTDDMVYIENESESWCENCKSNYAQQCEDCGSYVSEYSTTEDTNQSYCDDCIENNATLCEDCNEWYNDIEEHNEENHPEPTFDIPLSVDADGIFEIMPEFLETEVTVIYKWSEFGMTFETKTTTPLQQINDLKTAGAYMAKIKKIEWDYTAREKTFEINTGAETKTVTLKVYDVPGSGLFVYNRRMAQYQMGGKEIANEYAIMTPFGLWTNGNDKSLDGAMETLYNIKDLIDWNEMKSIKQWQSLPSAKLDEIHKAIYGG